MGNVRDNQEGVNLRDELQRQRNDIIELKDMFAQFMISQNKGKQRDEYPPRRRRRYTR